jgi:methylated-DNA-[protein]-cysteine S-methyltransferase
MTKKVSSDIYIDILETSPLGPIGFAASEAGLVCIAFVKTLDELETKLLVKGYAETVKKGEIADTAESVHLHDTKIQITDYLSGKRQEFNLSLDWSLMTTFQKQVLENTCNIPYGQVLTYGDIAREIGKPSAARAVGRAEATNPMPLVIPCHRVIGSDGGLHGYGGRGGIKTKAWLLQLEKQR